MAEWLLESSLPIGYSSAPSGMHQLLMLVPLHGWLGLLWPEEKSDDVSASCQEIFLNYLPVTSAFSAAICFPGVMVTPGVWVREGCRGGNWHEAGSVSALCVVMPQSQPRQSANSSLIGQVRGDCERWNTGSCHPS